MCDENVTAAPTTFNLVSNIDNVYIEYNYPIDLIEYSKIPSHCRIINKSKDFYFSVDGIFVAIGMIPNTTPLKEIVELNQDGYFWYWPDTLQSMDVRGLFVAGDVRAKNVRQAITAAADGAIAVQSVINYLKKNS
jgi:thioredoxin reductase (NADPH)